MNRQTAAVAILILGTNATGWAHAQSDDAAPVAQPLEETGQSWTAEEMEALLAPIALYPDPLLTQILLASTNPQEVLDAGNWLVEHPDLEGDALDEAAEAAGFTPPMRAVIPFRQIVDQMCLEMGWTTELGQAYTNDQEEVLAAVQRLRQQAKDVGNLQSSEQMKVETKSEDGQEVIVIEPPSPEVIYVPSYDPIVVYAPPPEPTVIVEDNSNDAGAIVAASVISFGVGLAIGAATRPYYGYYPNYWRGYVPPPPPYYYRPVYGGGYHPSHHYNRTNNYNKVLSDNKVVVVNKNDKYWGKFDDKPRGKGRKDNVKSPITQARPDRSDLKHRDRGGAAKKDDWKGRKSYAGADPSVRKNADLPKRGKMPDSKSVRQRASTNASTAKTRRPSGQGDRGYGDRTAGAANKRPEAATRTKQAASSRTKNSSRPSSRPQRKSGSASSHGRLSSGGGRSSARAASARGRSSMSHGGRSRGGGGRRR